MLLKHVCEKEAMQIKSSCFTEVCNSKITRTIDIHRVEKVCSWFQKGRI